MSHESLVSVKSVADSVEPVGEFCFHRSACPGVACATSQNVQQHVRGRVLGQIKVFPNR